MCVHLLASRSCALSLSLPPSLSLSLCVCVCVRVCQGHFISKQLAEMMQGSIAVASVEGEGSTFTITMPLALAPKEGTRVCVSCVSCSFAPLESMEIISKT